MKLLLKELREINKMSQAEMAKILNISQQTYSRYETHTTEIPLEKLIFLADYYHTSVDYLLGITDEPAPYPRKNVKWPSKLNKCGQKAEYYW